MKRKNKNQNILDVGTKVIKNPEEKNEEKLKYLKKCYKKALLTKTTYLLNK